jgi:hypothetical protein
LECEQAISSHQQDERTVDLDHLHRAVFEVGGLRHSDVAGGA